MVYGTNIFHNVINGTNSPTGNITIDKSQLSLFRHRKDLITAFNDAGSRQYYWLRDVASSSHFASVDSGGNAYYLNASNVVGVRPAFLIY